MPLPGLDSKKEALESRLSEKVKNLPTKPGIYQYKNSKDKIIYVGKAKNLRNRVRSYFRQGRYVDAKTNAMISNIADLEVIVVDSEAEALILEDTLIKKHKPRYNIMLRDDKTYPYVRITNEPYPRIFPTRKVIKDGSKYYGPFTEVSKLKSILRTVRNIFKIRTCKLDITEETIEKKKHKICLDYHINKCEGPCEGLVSEIQYNQNIKQAIKVLNGKTKEVEQFLEDLMQKLSDQMLFEQAAEIRDRLEQLRDYSAKQKMVSNDLTDRDVLGVARIDENACTVVFKIREGKLIGKRHYIVKNVLAEEDDVIIQKSIEKWYQETDFIPKEIHLPAEPAEMEYLLDWLGKQKGGQINIHIPKLGEKRQLVKMAEANAKFILQEYLLSLDKRDQVIPRSVISLKRDLRLKKEPRRIECFDNSHIQGSELVSSMVVFVDGKPKKSEYRKYKVKDVNKNDDFAAMRETIHRRYSRLKAEIEEGNADTPDLLIIDGGKGQLSSAFSILKDLGLDDKVPVIGLAKRLEEVFFPGESESLILPRTSSSLKLIQQLRDEAHRFAITYHRSLRDKRTIHSELLDISGVGKTTAEKLLKEFGSVEKIKKLSIEELNSVVNKNIADNVFNYFSEKEKQV